MHASIGVHLTHLEYRNIPRSKPSTFSPTGAWWRLVNTRKLAQEHDPMTGKDHPFQAQPRCHERFALRERLPR